jgi:glutaconyl-CoA/methylmalonyl-CoA decarboxylase subunit gamma
VRLTVEIDGRPVAVEVSGDLTEVRLGGHTYPVKVLSRAGDRVELEIGGEAVTVAGWPDHHPVPPGPVDVNGERCRVVVRAESGSIPPARSGPPPAPAGVPAPGASPPSGGEGRDVVPPMPGRVVEVRVREGETVAKGAVLLVLEAMKMRNEITAPVEGIVRDLRVKEGSSVRARETMLVLVPK